ncbi:hypothetical protein BZA05DRAFT_457686 [Tricharina praecox]|uniref:uncharacterized protein n=1 Tax=Tricharina praecox TaxID=43433 RepID=UPI0022206EF9|nr:uncharacterized protein BZA05DRAFT_457686 [Tricharina praecox]KAI5847586.1 hypothetical protein BZA05DRAFT_457686 [Tricharina praecox]
MTIPSGGTVVPETNVGSLTTVPSVTFITTPSSSSSSTTITTTTTSSSSSEKHNSLALPLGIGISLGVLTLLLLALGWFFLRRRRLKQQNAEPTPEDRSAPRRSIRWSFSPRMPWASHGEHREWDESKTEARDDARNDLAAVGGVGELPDNAVLEELPAEEEAERLAELDGGMRRVRRGAVMADSGAAAQVDPLATLANRDGDGHVLNFMEYHGGR